MQLFYHFTSIHGGVSKKPFKSLNLALHANDNPLHVRKNRQILQEKFSLKRLVFMDQIHSNKCEVISNFNQTPTCDAIITNKSNLTLCVLVADCIPLLFYDKNNHAIAAIHAGRAGVFGQIAKEALQTMNKHYGTKASQIRAILGPSIKQCCYELSGEVLKYAKENYFSHVRKNRLDIRGILLSQLENLGVFDIEDVSTCTCCDENYFSYRKDGITGRNAGIVCLRD